MCESLSTIREAYGIPTGSVVKELDRRMERMSSTIARYHEALLSISKSEWYSPDTCPEVIEEMVREARYALKGDA